MLVHGAVGLMDNRVAIRGKPFEMFSQFFERKFWLGKVPVKSAFSHSEEGLLRS
jgi:hypothetical protein